MAFIKAEAPPTRTRIPRAAKDNPKPKDEPVQANTSKPRAKKDKTTATKAAKPAGVTKKKAPAAKKAKAAPKKKATPKKAAPKPETVAEKVSHVIGEMGESVQELTDLKKTKAPAKKAAAKK